MAQSLKIGRNLLLASFALAVLVSSALGFSLTAAAAAHEIKVGSLVIKHPWSRQPPKGGKVAAGFLTIVNTGSEDDRLVSATAEISDNVQLHDMTMKDGVMSMFEMKDGIPIPAGATVELKPKSLHIMFIGIKSAPEVGTLIKGTLVFEKAGSVEIDYEVMDMGAGMTQ